MRSRGYALTTTHAPSNRKPCAVSESKYQRARAGACEMGDGRCLGRTVHGGGDVARRCRRALSVELGVGLLLRQQCGS